MWHEPLLDLLKSAPAWFWIVLAPAGILLIAAVSARLFVARDAGSGKLTAWLHRSLWVPLVVILGAALILLWGAYTQSRDELAFAETRLAALEEDLSVLSQSDGARRIQALEQEIERLQDKEKPKALSPEEFGKAVEILRPCASQEVEVQFLFGGSKESLDAVHQWMSVLEQAQWKVQPLLNPIGMSRMAVDAPGINLIPGRLVLEQGEVGQLQCLLEALNTVGIFPGMDNHGQVPGNMIVFLVGSQGGG